MCKKLNNYNEKITKNDKNYLDIKISKIRIIL